MKLAFIHRGSATAKMIMQETGIPRWGRRVRADLLVNYGVAGGKFDDWCRRNPMGRQLPMLNKPLTMNKFDVIKKLEDSIKVPRTRESLGRRHAPDGWLVKPFYSQAGRGIEIATQRYAPYGKYFQEYVYDRAYELRVHAFKWIFEREWQVQKRVAGEGNEDSITWNHHTGGTFITVNDTHQRVFQTAQLNAARVLEVLGMDFGGVDFIVDSNREVYFIEINSAVGCHGLSDPIYVDAFDRLKEMDIREVVG